jgi:membrane fusion protein (multidrug efflux system)
VNRCNCVSQARIENHGNRRIFIRDPLKFQHFIRSQKRRADSDLRDHDMQWDFRTLSPESAHQVTWLMGMTPSPHRFTETRPLHASTSCVTLAQEVSAMDEPAEVDARQNRQEAPPSKESSDPDGGDVPRDYKYKYKYKYEKGQDEDKDKDDEKAGDGGKGDKKDKDGEDGQKKPRNRTPIIILVVIAVIAIIGGLIFWLMTRNQESTDDAYTEGNAVSIAPKVSGYVVENRINDNVFVHAGDLLLKIDPRDFIVACDQAQANLDAAVAQEASAEVDLHTTKVRAPANLAEARAQLAQARANLAQSENDSKRQHGVDPRATTQTNVDQATTAVRSNTANVQSAEAQVSVAALVKETIETAEATLKQRKAQAEQAQANLAQAQLNLSYTDVTAPQDGQITRRNVDLGTFAQAGEQVFYLVTRNVWVVANYKETQLDRMRVGQRVDIKVDAYSDLHLSGHVESIQAGSGARFTAFPAENATGNFVKIVRRVPVKIVIDHGLENWPFLPLGLSVEPTVYFK